MKNELKNAGKKLMVLLLMVTSSLTLTAKDKEAEKVLNNYVTAIGGKTALAKIENIVSKSDAMFVEAGFVINREIVQDKTNHLFIKAYSVKTGEICRGFDGETYWEKNKTAVRVIDDEVKSSYINEFAFMRFSEWEKSLLDYTYQGIDTIEGNEMYRISVITIYGVKETWFFNTSNNLLSYIEEQMERPQGVTTVQTKMDDYREVDGIKHSFTQYIKMGNQNRKITFKSILHNQEIDPKIYSMPSI